MDNIIACGIGAVVMLVSVLWPRLGREWLHWPQTTIPVGGLARLGCVGVWGFLVGIMIIENGAQAEWWYCYLGMTVGIGLVVLGYYRDRRMAS